MITFYITYLKFLTTPKWRVFLSHQWG